jgi:hypothetical protein
MSRRMRGERLQARGASIIELQLGRLLEFYTRLSVGKFVGAQAILSY